ncbi:MAG: M23 family metallopeptidase [Dehalococcoidia bacterium]|nr:M23 family metallopeptidase [Dehalococcoidia bacterium]
MFKKLFLSSLFFLFVFLLSNEYFDWVKYNQIEPVNLPIPQKSDNSLVPSQKNKTDTISSLKESSVIPNDNLNKADLVSLTTELNIIYIDISPRIINSGEFFKVEISGNVNDNTSILFLDKSFPIFRDSLGNFSTYIGVPLETKEGIYKLTIPKLSKTTTIFNNNNDIQILKKDRGFDYIELSHEVLSTSFSENAVKRDAEIRSETSLVFSVGQYWSGSFDFPCLGSITTMFGVGRSYNKQPISSFHLGLDIGADQYTKVFAPAKGIIKRVDFSPLRGMLIYLDHGAGVQSSFAHLSSTLVSAGEIVEKGDLIGLVGISGASTGPHLHWEVSVWGVLTDPLAWTQDSLF